MIDFNRIWVDFDCTKCGFGNSIQLIDVKTEKTVYCHNCKVVIQLIDGEASTHNSVENINNSIKELDQLFKKLGK